MKMKKKLYLYKIWMDGDAGWDEYDSAVVCAENVGEAKRIHPGGYPFNRRTDKWEHNYGWTTDPNDVQVQYIGVANKDMEPGVVVASFNAG